MSRTDSRIRHDRMSKGAKAFRTGKPESSCPYAKGGEAWADWRHGFFSVKEGYASGSDHLGADGQRHPIKQP